MSINRVAVIFILVLLTITANIHAQTPAAAQPSTVSSVTGTVTPDGALRMIAHGESLQIRMEVYSAAGELMADTGLRQGNIIDWKQTDTTQPIIDGSYLVVVTVKDFEGNLNQRMAALTLQAGQLQLQSQKRDEVTTAQVRTMESRKQGKTKINDGDDAISILKETKERAAVVTAHNGTDGQVNSTSGALTFRTGNVFASQEQEQMRITPEGRVGIGTKAPETTLDVAGTIKARGGIQFDDGSVLSTAKGLPTKDAPGGGGGSTPSGTNIITAINDPATVGAINDNRVSLNLARLAGANTWSSFNTFSAGLSANNAQIVSIASALRIKDFRIV